MSKEIYLGENKILGNKKGVSGAYVDRKGKQFYRIEHYDQMDPFFMSIVSHSDHWLFVSSKGGISAGRKNPNHAIFPYYTVDKIHQGSDNTGSNSIFKATVADKTYLWEPFSQAVKGVYDIQRNIYKNDLGNEVIFEEINHSLGLSFCYGYTFSEKFGIVRKCELANHGSATTSVELLDGMQNILPSGIDSAIQTRVSNLVNAYKKNELDEETGLGMFMLSATIVDRAEPSEALTTNIVWSHGLEVSHYLLSDQQLENFKYGEAISTEVDVKAEPGAYFVHSQATLNAGEELSWIMGCDVDFNFGDVMVIKNHLANKAQFGEKLEADIEAGHASLRSKIALADGLQCTNDLRMANRHLSNVLFNIMRGGLFEDQYDIDKYDLADYIKTFNIKVSEDAKDFLETLPDTLSYQALLNKVELQDDVNLKRIVSEYLPISFSRRHGDPSRPWNFFSIDLKDEHGNLSRKYAGNWRDIFQNWEALALSIPGYITAMIARFVNASTVDGYNPYRINREGIDWEVVEPDDPWSYIGYWGDHQVIYLQKLLEIAHNHFPDRLGFLLTNDQFVYANVPYKIKGYDDLVADPQDTIVYDHDLDAIINDRVAQVGSDGRLVWGKDAQPLRTNLIEKLMVMLLAKVSNFIPEAGIWLNTQRPEWNDANNALVGNGVSMVTLYYMRRHVSFMIALLKESEWQNASIHEEVSQLFNDLQQCLKNHEASLKAQFTDAERRTFVDAAGRAGEVYRTAVYSGFSEKTVSLEKVELERFLSLLLAYIDHTIRANKSEDALYHAYNLIEFKENEATIGRLYGMLEGQVAVLSAGLLDPAESLEVLDALKASDIYREDQYSYMLYPDRTLPRFLEKNIIPSEFVEKSALAGALLADQNKQLLYQDIKGQYHFNSSFNNNRPLKATLEALKKSEKYGKLAADEYFNWLNIYEQMFNHKAFTGRSGTFFGYEGLGSIYWHMVSKLLVAAQETLNHLPEDQRQGELYSRLVEHYFEIRAGIGINKSPEVYGAFPTDPYSHTPANRGVQQPGMTGQVKEDILNRWAELGVRVSNSAIHFDPFFIHPDEFLKEPTLWRYYTVRGKLNEVEIQKDQLAFTYCQTLIIYEKSDENNLEIQFSDGGNERLEGQTLPHPHAQAIFMRDESIESIKVGVSSRH